MFAVPQFACHARSPTPRRCAARVILAGPRAARPAPRDTGRSASPLRRSVFWTLCLSLLTWHGISLAPAAEAGLSARATDAHDYTWTVRLEPRELSSTRQEAVRQAERKAQEQIAQWLRQIWPQGRWVPSVEELRERGILYDTYARPRDLELPDGPRTMFEGIADCRLSPEHWRWLLKQAQLDCASQRLWWLGQYVLAPITAVALIMLGVFQSRRVSTASAQKAPR
jgi:hypothetical protein